MLDSGVLMERRFRPSTAEVPPARRHAANAVAEVAQAAVATVELIVSELVANAVTGLNRVKLRVLLDHGVVRIEVYDDGPGWPAVHRPRRRDRGPGHVDRRSVHGSLGRPNGTRRREQDRVVRTTDPVALKPSGRRGRWCAATWATGSRGAASRRTSRQRPHGVCGPGRRPLSPVESQNRTLLRSSTRSSDGSTRSSWAVSSGAVAASSSSTSQVIGSRSARCSHLGVSQPASPHRCLIQPRWNSRK